MHDIRPCLPELFTDPGSLLYIGARVDAHSWLDELAEAGNIIDILEVWEQNEDELRLSPVIDRVREIFRWDVKEIDIDPDCDVFDPFWGKMRDYIFWWHGPEHLKADEIKTVLATLETRTRRTIALACPWGLCPQGAHEGNPYEVYQTTLYPDFFTELGYEVATNGEADKPGSEIVAWKRKGERFPFERYGD